MKVRHVDLYADEWLVGTAELDNATRGLYITACALIYSTGGPISLDRLRDACRREHGLAFNRQYRLLRKLGKLVENGQRITNKRCENELRKSGERSENAERMAAKRWKTNGVDETEALPPGIANLQPITTNHQPLTRARAREPRRMSAADALFEGGRLAAEAIIKRRREQDRDNGNSAVAPLLERIRIPRDETEPD